MSPEELEQLVELFLERRERELSPEAFAAERSPAPRGLLGALRAALAAEAQLGEARFPGPERVGPYRVVRTLGIGGMGVVHEVERDGRRYALKRLHPALFDERQAERFRREARLLAQLDHPGIVHVVEPIEDSGGPCLVLELVQGQPLTAAAAGLDFEAKLRLAIELAEAVEAVHAAGLLHRDLKPQNVLVRDDGRCVLVDFGLGAVAGDSTLTSTGDLLGTPRYMAPEQARGQRADERTDVWGLGQVLFELFTGRSAVEEGSREEVLRAVVAGRLRRPRALAPALPRALERVLRAALARVPARRYSSAAALADDLRRVQQGQRPRARPPGPLVRSLDAARQHPCRAAVLLVASLALVASSALMGLERRADARERHTAARSHLERAVIAWIQGESGSAARALESASELETDAPARALAHLLEGRAAADGDDWLAGLAALAEGDALRATERLAPLAAGDPLAAALQARALRLSGDLEGAERLVVELESRAPRSTVASGERAALLAARGEPERALDERQRATRLDPDDPRLRRVLAEDLFAAGRLAEGIETARRATVLGGGEPTELARFLSRAGDRDGLCGELTRLLEREPAAGDCRFALAVLLDAEHRVREAARAYEDLLEREPEHAWAMAYLAHLLAGADRGRCAECDRVFDEDPVLVDRRRAGELLSRSVRTDPGSDPRLLNTIVYLARDHELAAEVCSALEQALAMELPPAARTRLSDASAGLCRDR